MSDDCGCPPGDLCDGDRRNNCWIEGPVDPITGLGGVCLLKNLSAQQIIYILEHNQKAREDLKKVTTNAELLQLAEDIVHLVDEDYDAVDALQSQVNNNAGSIPFYTFFKGQTPYNGGG